MKGVPLVNAPRRRSEPRCVYGLHPVREYLRSRPGEVAAVWLVDEHDRRRRELAELAAAAGIAVRHAGAEALRQVCGGAKHQGVAAMLREFGYAALETVIAGKPRLLVAADGVEDPRNLGALIRSVAAAGAGGVILRRDRASGVTGTVEKTAAGATTLVAVCRVANMTRTLAQLRDGHGYWLIGLSADAGENIFTAEVPLPAVLVIGGESGMHRLVGRTCDLVLRIPMAGGVESLNVAVAAAVASFELRRQHVDRSGGGW